MGTTVQYPIFHLFEERKDVLRRTVSGILASRDTHGQKTQELLACARQNAKDGARLDASLLRGRTVRIVGSGHFPWTECLVREIVSAEGPDECFALLAENAECKELPTRYGITFAMEIHVRRDDLTLA